MEKMSLKAYAIKHKLSLFNVIKMTKSAQIPSEVVQENGKDVVYVLIEEEREKEVSNAIVREEKEAPYSLKKENARLKKEILKLHEEIRRLKNKGA